MSICIVQLCAPKQVILKFLQQKVEKLNLEKSLIQKQCDQINKQSEVLMQSQFQIYSMQSGSKL